VIFVSQPSFDDVMSRIIPWLQENVRSPGLVIAPDTDLIAQNLLDSMDLLRLVSFLEDGFGVALDPDQLVPENFTSATRIAALVAQVRP
jgi:acyl carrier protein